MKANVRILLAFSVLLTSVWASLPGCSQSDNPTPTAAPPPPAPKAEELKVTKQAAPGKAYGASDRYQKAMERLNKQGGQ
jgi:hypothetical protein